MGRTTAPNSSFKAKTSDVDAGGTRFDEHEDRRLNHLVRPRSSGASARNHHPERDGLRARWAP